MSTVRTAASTLAASTSIVVPAALLALGLTGPVDLPRATDPARALADGTARSALAFAGGTAASTTAFAGSTAGSAVELADGTVQAAVPAAVETADEAVDATTGAAEAVLQVVEHGSATVCPGAPVTTGVELAPGDVLAVARPLSLQTPHAAVQTATAVVDGTAVAAPSAGTLLSDPASVRLHGTGTGVSVSAPVVDEVRSGTSVQTGPVSARPLARAAADDAGSAGELAPEVEVGLGRELLRMDESVLVTTAGLGGPLTLRTTGGGSCTAVTWTITR